MEKFGPYTVHRTIRLDNPAFPQYTIMRKGAIIGRSLSAVDLGWCEFIERIAKWGRYTEHSAAPKSYSYRLRGVAARGRPTNAARARAAADLLKVPTEE